jgi:hypothetical protein
MTRAALTTNGHSLGSHLFLRVRKEVFILAAKVQALLVVLGAIAATAFNGATPWGP